MANATTNAILDAIIAKLPGVSAGQINLELFNTVDELAREALRVNAPTNPAADPDTWLAANLWVPNYQVILDGTLYRLYAQVGKPYASADLAGVHRERYMLLLQLSRSEAAGATPSTVYDRVIYNLRMRIPVARDAELKSAVFYAANKIRIEAFGLAALGTVDATPTSWLPTDKWDASYQALLQGSLVQLYLQVSKPWSSPDLAGVSKTLFDQELDLLGTDELVDATSVYQRFINSIRAQLPTAREAPVKIALFAVANKIRIDALRLVPLVDADTNPSLWLPANKWDESFQAAYYGTLSRLQMQVGQPWSDVQAAAVNQTLFSEELNLLRVDEVSAPTTIYARLLAAVRAQLPTARENVVNLAIFGVVDKLRVDVFGQTVLTENDNTPSNWLTDANWAKAYLPILYGSLSRLQVQVGQPWSNPEAAVINNGLFLEEVALLRSDELANSTTVYDRIIKSVRTQLPSAREAVVKSVLFTVTNKIRVDALRLAPLNDANLTDHTTWLPAGDWDDCYQALYYGVLSRLQMQIGQPWSNPEASAANNALYLEEFALLRSDNASTPATVYARLVDNLRVQFPVLRDGALKLEIYNTADKIRREALWLDPLTDANSDPTTWLPDDQWDNCYQALLHGTLFRFYSQSNKPWSNPEYAKEHFGLYQVELDLVRSEQSTKTPASNFERLMDILRVRLPGARDNVINIELYLLINDFLQRTNIWVDEISLSIVSGQKDYPLISISGVVNRLMALVDQSELPISCTLIPPTIYQPDYVVRLRDTPSASVTYKAYTAIALDPNSQPEEALPDWIIAKYREGIEHGLLSRMMTQPAKPYFNSKLAEYHGAKYLRAVSVARNEALHAFKFRGQGWAYPRNFMNRRVARV